MKPRDCRIGLRTGSDVLVIERQGGGSLTQLLLFVFEVRSSECLLPWYYTHVTRKDTTVVIALDSKSNVTVRRLNFQRLSGECPVPTSVSPAVRSLQRFTGTGE